MGRTKYLRDQLKNKITSTAEKSLWEKNYNFIKKVCEENDLNFEYKGLYNYNEYKFIKQNTEDAILYVHKDEEEDFLLCLKNGYFRSNCYTQDIEEATRSLISMIKMNHKDSKFHECSICYNDRISFKICGTCGNIYCEECNKLMDRCPFCRK